jgi:RNA polymerase sigma factor (sigma-70 family)
MYMSGPGTTGTTRGLVWSQLGDEMLARRAASGNDAAFTALYERYHGRLLAYCRSILLNAEDAHDATQNALENALRGLPTRDDGRPLRPWLYRIAHNEAISIMRRRQPHDELMPDTEPVSGLQPSPEVYAEQRGRLEQLVEDLRTLPERQRGALVMRELSGLSYDEIGLALGLTPANARRAVFDARSALLDVAGGRDAECVTIRHALSDGDRRSVRARRIRAHLRSCDGCSTFHNGIRTRQTDLPAIAPWLTGAAAASAIGIGVGGGATGGGLLAGGLGWGAMSGAAKGLAVVAIVATTGTAALQIERAAKPDATGGAPKSASLSPRAAAAAASAAAPAVIAQVAARRATRSTMPSARRQHASTGSRGGSGQVTTRTDATLKSSTVATAHKSKAPQTKGTKIPSASAPTPTSVSKPPEAAKPPSDLLADKLQAIHDQLVAAFAQAQNIAAAGTQGALQNASQLVASTISSVQSMLSSLLSSFGITVPTAVVNAPAPPSSPSSLSGLLSPVQQVLGSVNALLAALFGGQ